MKGHGQFCAIARGQDLLGGRWTLLVVREVLCGSRRFSDIRRGIPRISRTVLSERLEALVHGGVLARHDGDHGPEYAPTAAGRDLLPVLAALGTWGQRWLPRRADEEDLDADPVLVDMQRRVRPEALPRQPQVVRFVVDGGPPRFLLLAAGEGQLCSRNPGFPEPLAVTTPLAPLVAWWRGDVDFPGAQRRGLAVAGPRALARAFPGWFARYAFAEVAPAAVDGAAP
ncbi:winged helix-turn-helix transcriptional regulator [Stella sp.]|uniref:winged helix-turn-helix transcriptional regulator n=1 Tax=Stella sp. TaxID=2912054 RepID=UPI0035B47369